MAILEKEVWVKLINNGRYYESKGYQLPKHKDKKGRLVFIRGTKILVRLEDLPERSGIKVTKTCDMVECGNVIPNQPYSRIKVLRENGDGYDRCDSCARKKASETQLNNVKYEKSLEHFAIKNNRQYLLLEYSTKNSKKPNEVAKSTMSECLWDCPSCKSEYWMKVSGRTNHEYNCPYCRGMRVNHTNQLATTHPEIAKLLKHEQRGFEVTAGSHSKEEFICPDCGQMKVKSVLDVVKQGICCHRCSDGVSYPEKFILSLLSQLKNVEVQTQKTFEWSKNVQHQNSKLSGNKRYDFYLETLGGIIIEAHGEQHYEEGFSRMGGRNKSLEEEKENDRLKKAIAINSGDISQYITINCSQSNMEYIKNNIQSSKLSLLFDLSNINWSKCNEDATSSNVRKASDHWNNGIKSTMEISKLIKVHQGTVIKYLKRAVELGWCDYNSKKIKISN